MTKIKNQNKEDYETPTKNRNKFRRTETIKKIKIKQEIKRMRTEMKKKTYKKL
jgi:hypothetical protein